MPAVLSDYHGDSAQQNLLHRGAQMHLLIGEDPRYSYYGRTVGATSPDDVPLSAVMALAQLQGSSNYATVTDDAIPVLRAEVEAAGLSPMHYARWEGGEMALSNARQFLAAHELPKNYTICRLTDDTSSNLRASLTETTQRCGVLLPSLAVLTGRIQPGVCFMALTREGDVAACAAAAAFLHPEHENGKTECWWGMLSVHPDHRGQALSLPLGAAAMVAMSDTYGFTRFFTGVEPGNAPSEAVCQKMDLAHEGRSILGIADPLLVAGGRMTK